MKRQAEEFQRQARLYTLHGWTTHTCSICHYGVGYVFEGGCVYFDGGCGCVDFESNLQPRSWQDIADHYNLQDNEQVIRSMDEFWHFAPRKETA